MSVATIMATAVSGLQANAERFQVAAVNIVNANSKDFRAQLATSTSQAPSGVSTSLSQSDEPVDLVHEFVDMIEAGIGYGANAEVVDTARRMTGTLLNIVA